VRISCVFQQYLIEGNSLQDFFTVPDSLAAFFYPHPSVEGNKDRTSQKRAGHSAARVLKTIFVAMDCVMRIPFAHLHESGDEHNCGSPIQFVVEL
jgi:hypothetical protein